LCGGSVDVDTVCRCLLRQASYAIDAGLDVVQIRERSLEAAVLARLVSDVVAMARGSRTRVVVNDRLDVALACGAGGVHLPASSLPPAAARTMVPRGFLIGRSVHSVQEAALAGSEADYLIAGTLWPTETHPSAARLLELSDLRAIVRASAAPVLAIGGVTPERLPEVRETGAAGAAAIGMFIGPPSGDGCRAVRLGAIVQRARLRFDTPEGAS
jgi:thiamine-phosphate pyrophosphorylase